MNPRSSTTAGTSRRRPSVEARGFALVITLSLMILLTIIAVGLLSLSAISLRSTSQGLEQGVAQANARLALMLAIGELQKEMGPDQRISAPGGQLLKDGDKSGRKHWTGVYESWPAGSETRPDPVFRRWLLSGDRAVLILRESVESGASPATQAVTIVPADADSDPVEAGLVSTPKGACAWWVADENTKAKIGGRVEKAPEVDASVARRQSAPRASHEVFAGDGTARDAPQLDRIVSTETVAFLGKATSPLFHHLTTTATGLLTNVRSGGFRKDLSFYLDKPRVVADNSPLYTAGSTPGINFHEIWRDFNVWGEIVYPTNPPKHQDGGAMPSGVPTMVRPASPRDSASDPFLYYRSVTKLQTTLICSLIAEGSVVNGRTEFRLFLVIDPVYSIWNPLNIPIHIPQSSYTTFKTWALPYDLRLNLKGGPGGDRVFARSMKDITNPGDANFFNAEIGKQEPLTMRPGEVQIQSQGFNQPVRTLGGNKYHDNKLGWDFGSGYKFELKDDRGNAARFDGRQRITYSVRPNKTTSHQWGLFLSGHSIGQVDRPGDWAHIGGHQIDGSWNRQGAPTYAIEHPKIFPEIPEDPSAARTVANSFAPSVMAPYRIRTTLAGRDAADHSYLANLALWDDWFFSSISPASAPAYKDRSTAAREQKSRLEAFLAGQEKLPNPRFLPAPGDLTNSSAKIFTGSRPDPNAHERTAALMLVDGAFNVNSASVPAWKAMLSGLKGEDVPVRQTPGTPKTPRLTSTTDTPVSGLLVPAGGEIPPNSLDDPKNPEQWTGFRSLTDYQIDELAKAIVKQVRLRGPFSSLADFINRRPGNDKDLALAGALQSALDDPTVSINADFRRGGRSLPAGAAAGFEFPEAEAGVKAVGAPGYVKQGDLLTPLAPLIAVRGDTFLIRSYGEARDRNGKVTARAWCEAVVRRLPEYVDSGEPADLTGMPARAANRNFGRRFIIVSTRWLAPREI